MTDGSARRSWGRSTLNIAEKGVYTRSTKDCVRALIGAEEAQQIEGILVPGEGFDFILFDSRFHA
jgi:hypothetical protein